MCGLVAFWGVFLCGRGEALRLVGRLFGFVALAPGVRDALRSDALRGDARTVGAFEIARRMARTVNAWRGRARIGDGRSGAGVCPSLLNAHADFGSVTSPFRVKKNI